MLEKYLRRFRPVGHDSDEFAEEHFQRLFALSSELLLPKRDVAIMGLGLVPMGHVLGTLDHKVTALEFHEGDQSLLPTAGVVDEVARVRGHRLELEAESQDVLVSVYTFIRDVSRPLLLREMARVLRPGGQLLLVEPGKTKESHLHRLQTQHGLPVTGVEVLGDEPLRYYSKNFFEWKMPYHFSFGGGWAVFLGDRRWERVPESL
ncbi:MAG: methyltransferase domain-containing protein [Bdellovibrionota bacterium]